MKLKMQNKSTAEKKENLIVVEFRKTEDFEFLSTKIATQFEKNPNCSFEFNPGNADDGNQRLNIVLHETFPTTVPMDCISVQRKGKVCSIDAAVRFAVIINEDASGEDFNDWSYNEGGWSTAEIVPIGLDVDFVGDGTTYLGTEDVIGGTHEPYNFLEFSTIELRKNKVFVLSAVRDSGGALGLASEDLRHDKEVVMAAVAVWGRALQFTSDLLKNDKDVVLAAVTQDGAALQFASELLRADKDVVDAAFAQSPDDAKEYALIKITKKKK